MGDLLLVNGWRLTVVGQKKVFNIGISRFLWKNQGLGRNGHDVESVN